MIRAAIAPIIRQRRHQVFAATCFTGTGALCVAAPIHRSREYARCSAPSVYNDEVESQGSSSLAFLASSSLTNFVDDVEQCRALILPTMEALLRAARLAKTAVVMAADYQVHFLRRKQNPDSLFSHAYSFLFLPGNNSSAEERSRRKEQYHNQKQLEDTIEQLENDLERAQHVYVNSKPPSKDKENNNDQTDETNNNDSADPKTLSEQTLALEKRQQKEKMMDIASQLAIVQEELSFLDEDSEGNNSECVHERNAHRLLRLCHTNGGVYIKVGQHLANLDLLLPEEYIRTLSSLFDDAPVSSYQDVCAVVKEELGSSPDELFSEFSKEPLASASLAQVHTAICKETGKKLAIKVQHQGLRETSKGDLFAMTTVVNAAEKMFDNFNFGWICEEMTPQLPKELDFKNEGNNAETAAAHLNSTGLDCVVPDILWNFTSERVLCMEFEEGFRATDIENIEKAGICRREVAKLISSVFNAQIFDTGFVHCDPHEANVLLREHPLKKGKPQMVLVDHGLYKKLDGDFQEAYARLWTGIVMADIPEIKSACGKLGVHKMYPLLAAMLTSRPFDEVVERSQTRSLDASPVASAGGDKAVIRGYAQRYIKEIVTMLDIVPRQMLLIFKMNDCLRHVDMALGSPVNNLVVAGRYASRRVYESDQTLQKQMNGGVFGYLRSWLSYVHVLIRINSYELFARLSITQQSPRQAVLGV